MYFYFLWSQSHPQVMRALHLRFHKWLDEWLQSNVNSDDSTSCHNWFLGNVDGLKECKTSRKLDKDALIDVYKYSVDYPKADTSAPSTDPNL